MQRLRQKARDFMGVVDFMKNRGMDSSLEARRALGANYGITDVGTARGNEQLKEVLFRGLRPGYVKQQNLNNTLSQFSPTAPMTDEQKTNYMDVMTKRNLFEG